MKEGLKANIEQLGYVVVNYRPLGEPSNLSLQDCQRKMQDNAVALRGWDFPHVSRRNDEAGGYGYAGNYFGTWCDWNTHVEFSRLYQSGQFISYRAIHEDREDWPRAPEDRTGADVTNLIYSIVEFTEFAFRLARAGVYPDGVLIKLDWHNMYGRALFVSDFNKMPFMDTKATWAETISIFRSVDVAQLAGPAIDISTGIILEFFEKFGWHPSEQQILKEQQNFYSRR